MAGHVEDRWWRDQLDEQGRPVFNERGRPAREKTELFGKGMRYRVRYYVGKREKSKSFADRDKRSAEDFLLEAQAKTRNHKEPPTPPAKERLRTYTLRYLKGQTEDPISLRTIHSRLENMIFPFFGDSWLDAVTIDSVRDWLEWMRHRDGRTTTSSSYRAQAFDLLSAILNAASDEGRIPGNPCKAKSIKRPKPEERNIVPWSENKVWKVHEELPPVYKILTPISGGLGLRQMEALAFSPDDIDRDAQECKIVRQIRWIEGVPVFARPKGGKTRVVPIGTGVLQDIDEYQQTYEPVTMTLPWGHPGGIPTTVRLLINKEGDGIPAPRGGMPASRLWRGYNFQIGVWRTAVERTGLGYVKREDGMHALRHFYASVMLAQGVTVKELSLYLGHHDPAFTLRIYTHLMPSSNRRARLASDSVFKPRALPDAA